jgi:polar amino acid transport system substrate-binding protein
MTQRMLMSVVLSGFAIGIVTAAAAAPTGGAQAPTKSTNDGVYTKAQGERGQKIFAEKCTACHEPSRFSGEAFHESWDNKALKELWDVASGTMPEDNPGSLKQQEYADILAYFLSLNEYPAGDAELPGNPAAMAAIKIEKKK